MQTLAELEKTKATLGLFALDLRHGNGLSLEAIKVSNAVMQASRTKMEKAAQETVKQPFLTKEVLFDRMLKQGFEVASYLWKEGGGSELRVEEVKTGLQYPLTQVFPDLSGLLAEQVRQKEARQEAKHQQQEQDRREQLARQPHARKASIEGTPADIAAVKMMLEGVGANIWREQAAGDKVRIEVSYQRDYATIERIHQLLQQISSLPGASLRETDADRDARREAVRILATPLGQSWRPKAQGLNQSHQAENERE